MTLPCLSCANGVTEASYCEQYPSTVGCTAPSTGGMTAGHTAGIIIGVVAAALLAAVAVWHFRSAKPAQVDSRAQAAYSNQIYEAATVQNAENDEFDA